MSQIDVPDKIGPYRVLRPIGQGGMSEVFVVENPSSQEHLALKLLVEVGDAIPRFNREYEALIRLNHPGIVRVYNYGLHEKRPWFSMELLEGLSLQAWMKQIGRPGTSARNAEVLRVAYYLAVALAYIHRRKLIHRDLKSANVMVLPDGRVKLLDFGTAHLLDPADAITKEGEFIGTFAYASPEQFRSAEIDHRADLYTLGVLLYRVATGRRPFKSEEPAELARMHTRQAPVPPQKHVPSIPDELNDLILSLMQKKPDDRPQKASAVVRRLVEIAGRPLNMSGFGLAMRCDRPIGRERELKTIERVLDGTIGRSILVTGDDGSGLAGFVNMTAMEARARGLEVIVCTLKSADPLGAFVSTLLAFCEYYLKNPPGKVETALGGLGELMEKTPLDRWNYRELVHVALGTIVSYVLETIGRSMVLVVHKQHHATPFCMDVFSRLTHAGHSRGLSVQYVFAARPSGWLQGANPRQRFPGALHLQLRPLSVRQVALTIGSMLYRRPPPDHLARTIHQVTGGEPVWVEQVVQHLVDSGHLRALGAEGNHLEWDVEAVSAMGVPGDAEASTRIRYSELPLFSRRCLEALSICGERASLEVLAESMGWKKESFLPVVEQLIAQRWLGWNQPGEDVQWVRPLDRRIVHESMDDARRQTFIRTLGRMVDRLPPSETLVTVLLASGETRQAMEMALACAQKWMERQQVLKALNLLDEVVGKLQGHPELDRVFSGRLHLMHADCLMRLRPTDAGLSRSIGVARSLANKQVTLATIELLQSRLHRQLGHFPGFRKYVQRAWEHASKTDDCALKSRIASYQMQAWLNQGRMNKAQEWLGESLNYAQQSEDERVLAYARIMSGQLALLQGNLVDAEESLEWAMEVFERTGHRRGLWLAVPQWAETLRYQGRFSEALAMLYRELPEARSSHVPLHYLQILLAIARCEIDLCRLGKAQECVDELEVNIRRGEHLSLRLDTMLAKGRILILSGQYRKALAVLQEAHERARSAELPVIYEYARSLMAGALWGLNSKEQASGMFESACLGLLATGNFAAVVLASISWAQGMSGHANPETIFLSIRSRIQAQPFLVVRIEEMLAGGHFYIKKKARVKSRYHFKKASEILDEISEQLNDTDRAALRVHPWSVQIRAGIR